MEVVKSPTVTAVTSLSEQSDFDHLTVDLVIELSWSVTEGDMSWTVTKTSHADKFDRFLGEISAEEGILVKEKLRNI